MRAESGGQTLLDGRPITSRAGAMGLMQVMPETYEEMRLQLGLGGDPYDPHDNVLAGAAYLREMYDRYGYPGFLAAYNAGPERYDDYLIRGRALPQETLGYLAAISPNLRDIVLSQGASGAPSPVGQLSFGRPAHTAVPSGSSLFFALSSGSGEQVAAAQTMPDEAHAPGRAAPCSCPCARPRTGSSRPPWRPAALRSTQIHSTETPDPLTCPYRTERRASWSQTGTRPREGVWRSRRSLTGGKGLVSVFPCYQPGRSARQGCAVPPKCCAFWLPRAPLARRLRRP